MTAALDILVNLLEKQKTICCQNTAMHLEMICEQLYYTHGINATYHGKSIYINNERVASIQTCKENKNNVGICSYKIL